ncbi:PstS family phosphate ABC transporter substrate-binding protein [Flavobacterium sp. WC2409]|uniref:PstS family phosphate ABC transporter substrate-binding protein n=1 Tax=Flavobacterium sp. WC2409 TaxID=3234139 RepID=A0AB39W4J3_9FLAO
MKKTAKLSSIFVCLFLLAFLGCKQSENSNKNKETILKGSTSILVDETLKPIIEEQIEVFQSEYNAKITLIAKSENEVIKSFLKDSTRIVVLARTLNKEEEKYFESVKIKPKTTIIGTDAIAFVSNKSNNDTLIALQDVVSFMQGKSQQKIKGLVFDNLNSSTLRYLKEVAGLNVNPSKGIYSFKTNEEVLKYVSENEGMLGVVGLNWLYRPTSTVSEYLQKLNVLSVKGLNEKTYVSPTQNNLAEGTYPLARDLYIINCQGYSGLGMGFASFMAGDIGQRIILKSGLLPFRTPGRKIIITTKSK